MLIPSVEGIGDSENSLPGPAFQPSPFRFMQLNSSPSCFASYERNSAPEKRSSYMAIQQEPHQHMPGL